MSLQSGGLRHLAQALTETAARVPDKEAIVFGALRLTWHDVERRVDALAQAFLTLGVQLGEVIGIQCTTRPEYVITYLAALRVGAVLAGFNAQYTPYEVGRLAALVHPVAVVLLADGGLAEKAAPALQPVASIRAIITIGESTLPGTLRFEDLIADSQPALTAALVMRQAEIRRDDGALIVFTGGTTGSPKGALLSHANILSNIGAQIRHFDFRGDDRLVLHLPMNHVSGANLIAIAGVLTGATLVMLERFDPAETLALVARERCTLLGQVPTMFILEFLLKNYVEYDLTTLRTVIVSGAPTPEPAMRQIAAMAPVAVHAYGLTESTGMVTYTRPHDAVETLLGSAGQIAAEYELRVVDAAHQPVPAGMTGEIALRGDCVMKGYVLSDGDVDAAIDAEGWLYTGDLGRLDAAGYLTVVGRCKELIITGGYNVYPQEVEAYLDLHPKVAVSACLGRSDPVMGEIGVAFVAVQPGQTLTVQELRAHCRHGLARYKNPAEFRIVDDLPLTALGKVDKTRLRASLATD